MKWDLLLKSITSFFQFTTIFFELVGALFIFNFFTSAGQDKQIIYFLLLSIAIIAFNSIKNFYIYEVKMDDLTKKLKQIETTNRDNTNLLKQEMHKDNSTTIREIIRDVDTLIILDQRRWLKVGQLLSVYENENITSLKPIFMLSYIYQTHTLEDNGFPVCRIFKITDPDRCQNFLNSTIAARGLIVLSYVNSEDI